MLSAALIAAAPPALGSSQGDTLANVPANEIVDGDVPALKDGRRMGLEDVERAILQACTNGKFAAEVIAPGVISARWSRLGKSFEVVIPFSDVEYAIHFKEGRRMNEESSSEHISGLAEQIESDLDRALVRFKSLQKPMKRAARINPRTAV